MMKDFKKLLNIDFDIEFIIDLCVNMLNIRKELISSKIMINISCLSILQDFSLTFYLNAPNKRDMGVVYARYKIRKESL